jgi:diketogulonate reductase-like aldo/keto reductase
VSQQTGPGEKTQKLADGNAIPMLGLGVWQVENSQECVDAVRWALEAGYRHIDTAQAYGNEDSVGRGLRESGVPREQVFVTTKFFPRRRDPVAELDGSLRRLGLEYVDLYIVHWPAGGPLRAWPGMERALELGHTRSIGVSNFDARQIDDLLQKAERPPVVNQVLFNPFAYRKRLLEACAANNIVLEAYSPLGTGKHLNDPAVAQIAEAHGRTPAQVLLRWGIQHGVPQIPKSTHQPRIIENAQLFDFELSDDEVRALDVLDRTGGTDRAREDKWWQS